MQIRFDKFRVAQMSEDLNFSFFLLCLVFPRKSAVCKNVKRSECISGAFRVRRLKMSSSCLHEPT